MRFRMNGYGDFNGDCMMKKLLLIMSALFFTTTVSAAQRTGTVKIHALHKNLDDHDTLKTLLDSGKFGLSDFQQKNNIGNTIIHEAMQKGYYASLAELLQYLQKKSIRLNELTNSENQNPLEYGVSGKFVGPTAYLLHYCEMKDYNAYLSEKYKAHVTAQFIKAVNEHGKTTLKRSSDLMREQKTSAQVVSLQSVHYENVFPESPYENTSIGVTPPPTPPKKASPPLPTASGPALPARRPTVQASEKSASPYVDLKSDRQPYEKTTLLPKPAEHVYEYDRSENARVPVVQSSELYDAPQDTVIPQVPTRKPTMQTQPQPKAYEYNTPRSEEATPPVPVRRPTAQKPSLNPGLSALLE